eukprot:2180449-Rhodomonas_salina.2
MIWSVMIFQVQCSVDHMPALTVEENEVDHDEADERERDEEEDGAADAQVDSPKHVRVPADKRKSQRTAARLQGKLHDVAGFDSHASGGCIPLHDEMVEAQHVAVHLRPEGFRVRGPRDRLLVLVLTRIRRVVSTQDFLARFWLLNFSWALAIVPFRPVEFFAFVRVHAGDLRA